MTITEDEFTNRPSLQHKRAVAMMIQRATFVLIALYCVASMTALVILGLQGQSQRKQLFDCTTPPGKCYQNAQKRTGEAIQALIDDNTLTRETVIAAIACAEDPANDTQAEIKGCVQGKVKR